MPKFIITWEVSGFGLNAEVIDADNLDKAQLVADEAQRP